ncbi:MAG: RNA 2',3'-cyclic phosphodiesterase, partial [Thermoproteota archaeon]
RARLFGVGAFPSMSRPRVIWVGVEEGREELVRLMRWVDSRLRRLGFPREDREPHPHLTIARVKWLRDRESLKRVLSSLLSTDFGEIEVREIRLKKSTLTPKGPIYETLASIPLRAEGG